MSDMHDPGHDNPQEHMDNAHPKPPKECPICGDESRDLPHHIRREH